MTDLAETRDHKIFRVGRRGRAYVVAPQGDTAGFGHADLKVERERVISLLSEPGDTPNLIVDLGDANYFGSEMIGFINRMLMTVKDRNGEHAVINISDDMIEGIQIMRLEELWNVSTSAEAARQVARENPLQAVRRNARGILLACAAIALVAVCIVVWSMLPSDRNASDYRRIAAVWNEYQTRRKGVADLDFVGWKKTQLPRMQALADRLEKTASVDRPAQQHMLWACREYMPKLLDPNLKTMNQETARLFVEEMEKARLLIEEQYGIELPALRTDGPSLEPSETDDEDDDSETGHGGHDAPPEDSKADPKEKPNTDPDPAKPDPTKPEAKGTGKSNTEATDAADSESDGQPDEQDTEKGGGSPSRTLQPMESP